MGPAGTTCSEDGRPIGRTRLGLGLLVVAVLLDWIPYVFYLGILLGIIGAILMLLGSSALGRRHHALVVTSILVFIAAEVAEVILFASFASTIQNLPSNASGPVRAARVLDAFDSLMTARVVVASIIGVADLLIAIDLEDSGGKILLLAGVGAQIAVSALAFAVLGPVVHQAVTDAFASTPMNPAPLQRASAEVEGLSPLRLFDAMPALFFAVGYAWAYGRIRNGVIPRAPAPPSPRSKSPA